MAIKIIEGIVAIAAILCATYLCTHGQADIGKGVFGGLGIIIFFWAL